MLILPIKKKWFEMIKNEEKKEEYREIKPYYEQRFIKYFRNSTGIGDVLKPIIFRNGYSHNSSQIKCICSLRVGTGKKEWGAVEGQDYYILKIIKVYKEE